MYKKRGLSALSVQLSQGFENEELMVINKPADMPTHPSHNHHSDTVANAVAHLYSLRGQPLVFRPMGRLDRNTSGIVVLAKNAISASFLSYARRHGLIRKSYIAILCGHVDCNDGLKTIRTYMKRSADSVIMRCVSDESEEGSMQATTHFRVLYTNDKISLVEAFPETGRTHQLRVHFAHIGHPILGDDIYGQSSSYIARHALHAESLSLPLPYDIEKATKFCAGVPADMQDAFNAITGLDLNNIIERSRQGEI